MQDFQQRVVDELTELDIKRRALRAFMESDRWNSVPEHEQDRLQRQELAMDSYSRILSERIDNFA